MATFEILVGDPLSTVIIHAPHGGMIIPESVRAEIVLNDLELANESVIMADIATDEIARDIYAKSQIKPWVFINTYSRLVIDPERFPDEREEMNAVGMGVVYTKTSDQRTLRRADDVRDRQLVDEYFQPYSDELSDLTSRVLEVNNHVTLLDLHSFAPEALPYELHKNDERPALCLGADEFHTATDLIVRAKAAFASIRPIAINQPFSGTYVPLAHYGVNATVQSLMLEIRKDTYAYGNKDCSEYWVVVESGVDLVNQIQAARTSTK